MDSKEKYDAEFTNNHPIKLEIESHLSDGIRELFYFFFKKSIYNDTEQLKERLAQHLFALGWNISKEEINKIEKHKDTYAKN